jgi:hypothetical protein
MAHKSGKPTNKAYHTTEIPEYPKGVWQCAVSTYQLINGRYHLSLIIYAKTPSKRANNILLNFSGFEYSSAYSITHSLSKTNAHLRG